MISIHDTLVAAGLDVEDFRVPGYRNSRGSGPELDGVEGILIHHNVVAGGMRTFWSALHASSRLGRKGLPAPHYQIHVAPTGLVAVATDGRANHAGAGVWPGIARGGNGYLVGIVLHALGDPNGLDGDPSTDDVEVFPMTQIRAAAAAAAAICRAAGLPASLVLAHWEWASTNIAAPKRGRKIDPWGPWGDGRSFQTMDAFRSLVADQMTRQKDDDMPRTYHIPLYKVKADPPGRIPLAKVTVGEPVADLVPMNGASGEVEIAPGRRIPVSMLSGIVADVIEVDGVGQVIICEPPGSETYGASSLR